MLVIFTKVAEIFAILVAGFAANKKGILPDEASPYLVNLLLIITSPCLIITSIAEKELTPNIITETLCVLGANAVFFVVGALLSLLLVRLLKIGSVEDRGVLSVIMCSVNSGFMGFPITLMIFGQEAFYYMVLCNIVLTLYLYSVAFLQIGSNTAIKKSFIEVIKPMFNLCMIAGVIGVIILFTGIKLPSALMEVMKIVGDATIPVAMIIVGMLLAGSDLKSMFTDKNLLKVTFFAMIVWPALTFGIMYFIPMPTLPKAIVIFSSAFPSAAVVPALAQKQGKNSKLAAQAVSLTTLVSMVTIPVMAMLLMSVYNL